MKKFFIAISLVAFVFVVFSCGDKNKKTCKTCGWAETAGGNITTEVGEKCDGDIDAFINQGPQAGTASTSATVKNVQKHPVCK